MGHILTLINYLGWRFSIIMWFTYTYQKKKDLQGITLMNSSILTNLSKLKYIFIKLLKWSIVY